MHAEGDLTFCRSRVLARKASLWAAPRADRGTILHVRQPHSATLSDQIAAIAQNVPWRNRARSSPGPRNLASSQSEFLWLSHVPSFDQQSISEFAYFLRNRAK